MTQTTPSRSSIGSLVAARRRRLAAAASGNGEPAAPAPAGASGLQLHLAPAGPQAVEGHAFDPAEPGRALVVELLLDGWPAAVMRAERFDPVLAARGIGDGCHGFRFPLTTRPRRVGLRLANRDDAPAVEIEFGGEDGAAQTPTIGAVEWAGGLRLAGWVPRPPAGGEAPRVEAFLDGERVAHAPADRWHRLRDGGGLGLGFALALPREHADGRPRSVEVRLAGRPLGGSPVTLLAFADGLEAELAGRADLAGESLRGGLLDLALPDAVPFSAVEAFEGRFFPPAAAPGLARPVAVAVVGGEAAGERTLASPGLEGPQRWVGGLLSSEAGPTHFQPDDLLRFLDGEAGDCAFVLFVAAGARLRPGALARLVSALEAEPSAALAYGDVLLRMEDGTLAALALPAFDPERFLEQGTASLAFAMRRAAAQRAARRGIDEMFRLFLSAAEDGGAARGAHLHVPGFTVLAPRPDPAAATPALMRAASAHLAERGVEARVEARPEASLPAVRVRRARTPRSSVAIVLDAAALPDAEAVAAALAALEPMRARTRTSLALVAGALPEPARHSLALDGIAVQAPASPRETLPERLGRAAEAAEADLVLFLDARLAPEAPDALEEMLGRIAEPEVGAVGPVIAGPDGLVAEAGLVLRPGGRVAPAFADRMAGEPGYGDALRVARQVAALGRRCLLLRRADFLGLGGFDPALFPFRGGEIDLGLKLQALGRRLVVTPDALFTGPAPGAVAPGEARLLARAERLLFARWPEAFACDPFYSPLLDRGASPFSGLAWPPGPLRPRRPAVAPARSLPLGW